MRHTTLEWWANVKQLLLSSLHCGAKLQPLALRCRTKQANNVVKMNNNDLSNWNLLIIENDEWSESLIFVSVVPNASSSSEMVCFTNLRVANIVSTIFMSSSPLVVENVANLLLAGSSRPWTQIGIRNASDVRTVAENWQIQGSFGMPDALSAMNVTRKLRQLDWGNTSATSVSKYSSSTCCF